MRNNIFNSINQRFALWQAVVFCALLLASPACKDDSLLGLELQPDGQLDTLQFIDTFTVNAVTTVGTPNRSDEAQSYIGMLRSAEFGTSTSNLIINFDVESGLLSSELATLVADSVVLQIRPNKIYGDLNAEIPIEVLEIDQPLYIDSAYYSDFAPSLKPEILGSKTLKHVGQIEPMEQTIADGDTLPLVFRIPLSVEFGESLMKEFGVGWTNLSSFREGFGGLMIRVAEGAAVANGSIYSFAMLTGESKMLIYYTPGEDQEIIELPISSTSSRINQFSHNYSGSTAESYINSPQAAQDLIFVQGLSGLKSEIQIPGLQSFGEAQNSAIAKATLNFKLADMPFHLGHSPRLFLLELDEDGTETLTPDFVDNASRADGFYSVANNDFTFDITQHVQRIAQAANEGRNINHGLTLNAQVPVLNGNDTSHNIIHGLDNIVLKVYHTDLNN